jgi:CBS domain-containing protein
VLLVEHMLAEARKRLVTIADDAPLLQVAALLGASHVSLVVVCDVAGRAIGVVSKADVVRQISHCAGHSCTIAVASVMTRDIIKCAPRDWLNDVWSRMKRDGVRQIPILDGNSTPLGIVYAVDAVHALLSEAQDQEQLLRDYIMCVGYH